VKRLAIRTLAPAVIVAMITAVAVTACGGGSSTTAEATPAAIKAAVPKRPSVLFLIFDEWPIDIMINSAGVIDPVRYPNIAALTKTATWFPNAHTTYDSTTRAIPQAMDGKLARKETTPDFAGHPRTVFDLVGRHGYRVRASEEATSVCPPRYCPRATRGRPAILKLLQKGRRDRFEGFLRSVKRGKPTLYLKHTLLPHGPYLFLPSGKQTRPSWQDPIPGMNSPQGFRDRFLTEHNMQRLELQIGYVDHVLGKTFDRMKREGTFNNTLIAITADHGIAFEVGVKDRRTANRGNIDEIAPVPLIIKAPGQTKGRIDRSYVRTVDVVPTIADILNFRMPYRADGRSAFSRATKRRRSVRLIKRDFDGTIVVPARTMERRREALRAVKRKLLGEGDWASLYTGIGPNRALLGRQVAELPQAPRNGVRIALAQAAAMRSVNPRSELLPTQVAGRIKGGAGGARRDLAVAVNGKLDAVGRSFYLAGSGQESFALMVPESSMQPGRNTVQVFEVVGGNALRLIGST
jgi:hypothetical protein